MPSKSILYSLATPKSLELIVNFSQTRDKKLHHMRSAECVGKPCVFGSREGEARQAELTDAAQALNLGSLEQTGNDGLFLLFERDEPMNRITKEHGAGD